MADCLDAIKKDFLREELKEAVRKKKKKLGPDFDDYQATVAIRELSAERLRQMRQIKREKALQFLSERRGLTEYMNHFADDPGRGARLAWVSDPNGQNLESNVFSRAGSLIAENNALLKSLAKLRPRVASWGIGMKKNLNDNILRELRGKSTGDPLSAQVASEIRAAIDDAWRKYRIAGGRGGTIQNYLPQHWMEHRVAAVTRGEYIKDAKAALDRSQMKDLDTDEILDDEAIDELLSYAYDSITTRGANKWVEPGVPPKVRTSINKKRDQSRILHFTPEGDIMMREKYMNPDIMATFQHYRDDLLRDTAKMQIMGPNPDKFMKVMTNAAKHRIAKLDLPAGLKRNRLQSNVADIEIFHEMVMNRREFIGTDAHRMLDSADQTVRFGSTALLLGGALIPSVSDFATQGLNNMVRGTDMITRIGEYVAGMANSEKRAEGLINDMLIYDTLLNADSTAVKFTGSPSEKMMGFFGQSAELVLEKSGLTLHTEAGRHAGMRTHQLALGRDTNIKWGDLDPRRRGQYESYGFDKQDWDRLNKIDLGKVDYYGNEMGYFDFHKARAALDDRTFRRLHEMIMHEGQLSTLTSDPRAEKILDTITLGRNAAAGSPRALVTNQLKMFKRFPVMAAVMLRETAMNSKIPGWTRATALPIWLMSATMLGGLALQTRQLLQGRNPLPMTDDEQPGGVNWGFMWAAVLYGGGAPVVGDVLPELLGMDTDTLSARGYHGKSLWDIMPSVGLGKRLLRPLGEAWGQFADGDYDSMIGTLSGEFMAETARNTAGLFGGNIWYTRAIMDHLIFQQWEQYFDPAGFADKTDRQQNYLEGQGTSFFWLPGQALPGS